MRLSPGGILPLITMELHFFIGITFGYLLDSNIRISRSKNSIILDLHNSCLSANFHSPQLVDFEGFFCAPWLIYFCGTH